MTVLYSGDFLSHLGVENSVFYLKINRIKHRKHKKDVAMLGKRFISIASKCFPMYKRDGLWLSSNSESWLKWNKPI